MYFQMADFNQFVYIGDVTDDGRDRKKGTFFGHIFEGQINAKQKVVTLLVCST